MISAVIPTYRGGARLGRNLGSVVASLDAAGEAWEILVVDDGGGGVGALPEGARAIVLERNQGYGPAVNAGARAAVGELLLILNDDVRLEEGTALALRGHFPDATLFAVVPAVRSPLASCGDEGGKAGVLHAGLIEIREVPAEEPHPTLYAVGCCFLCPRKAFLALGGYDDVFAPFFWEDVDLGYRAWRRGLRILHVPEAVCHHEGSSTLSEHSTLAERERIGFRNRVLFHLKNLRDPGLRAASFGAWAAYALFETRAERLQGMAEALALFDASPRRRAPGLRDAEILERASGR